MDIAKLYRWLCVHPGDVEPDWDVLEAWIAEQGGMGEL